MMIKTVIIGAGSMGRRHLQAVRKNPDFEFAGICDLSSDALRKCQAEDIRENQCYRDSKQLLKETLPDCAIISTTAPGHFPLAMQAVKAGIPLLLVEKPLCISLWQLEELREAASSKNIRIAINHSVRFCGNYIKIKELANTPGLGKLTSFCLTAGNMGLSMGASHQFEFFHFLTGNGHDHVWAWFQPNAWPNPRGAQFQDAAGQIRLENNLGQRQYLEIGPDQGHGFQITLGFEKGQILADLLANKATINMRRPQDNDLPTTRYGMQPELITENLPPFDVIAAASSMLDALANGENYPDLDAGERIIRTLVAGYVSHENGHSRVEIKGDLPKDREFPWA